MLKKLLPVSLLFSTSLLLSDSSYYSDSKFSGEVQYRYDIQKAIGSTTKLNDIEVTLKSFTKLNDTLSFNTEFLFSGDYYSGGEHKDTSDIDVKNIYLKNENSTSIINLGRLVLDGPFSDEAHGNGVELNLIANDNMKILFDYYFNNSAEKTKDTRTIQAALINNFGSISTEVWRVMQSDVDFTNFTFNAKTDITNFNAMYTWADYENSSSSGKPSLTKLDLDLNLGYINYNISYAITSKTKGYVSIDESTDAKVNYSLWQLDLKDKEDSNIWAIDISALILPKITLRAAYADGQIENFKNASEYLGELSYSHSKNFSTYFRASQYSVSQATTSAGTIVKDVDYNKYRIEMKYIF
jgi:hypothetical protein